MVFMAERDHSVTGFLPLQCRPKSDSVNSVTPIGEYGKYGTAQPAEDEELSLDSLDWPENDDYGSETGEFDGL
jgi:hypothetical protein